MCGFQLSVESDQAINLVLFFFLFLEWLEWSNVELIDVVLVLVL